MQVSLQPTHSLANKEMKPKHCVSSWAHCNWTSEHQIHYTNSQVFETVLNYRVIAISYAKWEKFVSCFRWRIHQRSGKYSTLLPNTFVRQQFAIMNPITWNVRMRKILWSCLYVDRIQQNHLYKSRYPYIHSMEWPTDATLCSEFISLQVHSTCFGRYTRPSSGVQF